MTDGKPVSHHLLYRQVRHDVTDLVGDRPDAAATAVPACPDWTVRDLVEHFVDVCDYATRKLTVPDGGGVIRPIPIPGADTPPVPQLLDRWRTTGERLDDLVAARPDQRSRVLVMDAFSHELDLREALGVPPPGDDHPAYLGVLDIAVNGFGHAAQARELPPLQVVAPGARWTVSGAEPVATVSAPSRFELLRCLTGRRTVERIAALEWSTSPVPWLPAFSWGPFTTPEQ